MKTTADCLSLIWALSVQDHASVQKGAHSLRGEIAKLGYFILAEVLIGTREYFIVRLDDPERRYVGPSN